MRPNTCGLARGVMVAVAIAALSCETVPPLETLVRGGAGPPTLVLLHGYGSSAEEWLPFTSTIQLPGRGRFIFPQGPVPGPGFGRGWWPMDLSASRGADGLPDLSAESPEGLAAAALRVRRVLDETHALIGGRIAAGGFSQGGMVMADIAFRSETPIEALVLLSTTMVDEREWMGGYARRRRLPIFIAHGRSDPVLSFPIAERFQAALRDAGLDVTWYPFDGAHEIPAEVVSAMNQFLARTLAAR